MSRRKRTNLTTRWSGLGSFAKRFRPRLERLEDRCLLDAQLSDGVWLIRGDADPNNLADVIVIDVNPENPGVLRATINGQIIDEQLVGDIVTIKVCAGLGNDQVTVDLAGLSQPISVQLMGGAGDDLLTGSSGDDQLYGAAGADTLIGGEGIDQLFGRSGDDLLTGASEDDVLFGGSGFDTLAGGANNDQLVGGPGADELHGGFNADLLDGRIGNDSLDGGNGADSLVAGLGKDWVSGQSGDDTFVATPFDVVLDPDAPDQLGQIGTNQDFKQWLIDSAVAQWKDLLGQPVDYGWPGGIGIIHLWDVTTDEAGFQTLVPALAGGESGDVSQTNNQEAGVDEGDFVKTDGEYLYVLSGQELVIVDAQPAEELHVVSRIPFEGIPVALYLIGNRLTVISQLDQPIWLDPIEPVDGPGIAADRLTAPEWINYNPRLQVTVLDVTNRETPAVVEQTTLDGTLISSRAVDDRVYIVVENFFGLPGPELIPTDKPDQYVYETEAEYRARLEEIVDTLDLPSFTTSVIGPDGADELSGSLVAAADLFIPPDPVGQNLLSVVLFDMDDGISGPDDTTSVVGLAGQVYASSENLYIAAQTWDAGPELWGGDARTDIYKFGLGEDDVTLEATGAVAGWVLNQFSMDEEDGFFRIATTSFSDNFSNSVFIMAEQGDALEIVGSLTGLAVSEQIYAVRFLGDEGYVVTFRQIDPLFALDLSDPTAPSVAGELKIPGFSSYLHPVGENFLIGLGRDADPETGMTGALQISLFDVSDLRNPTRIDVETFNDGEWTGSEAEWDHHAFSYFAESGVLALPVWSDLGDRLEVIQVDLANGFSSLGQIEHEGAVRRTFQIGNLLYSISDGAVQVHAINNPGQQVASLTFGSVQ